MSRRAFAGAFVAVTATLGCSDGGVPSAAAVTDLPAGTLARVASEEIPAESVKLVAERQAVAPREALARLLSDAVIAVAARDGAPFGVVSTIERAATARSLLELLDRDARAAGPATDSELRSLIAERWPTLDRPTAARTKHAVVLNEDSTRDARARAVAEAVRAAVRGSENAEDFEKRAKSVDRGGFELRVEDLPPVTPDGRAFERNEGGFLPLATTFDKDFSQAANQLTAPGELSPVIKTTFGYHVIRLQERIPGASLSQPALANAAAEEAWARRAVRARKELIDKLRATNAVQIERSVDELTARVTVAP